MCTYENRCSDTVFSIDTSFLSRFLTKEQIFKKGRKGTPIPQCPN